jgi:hypothetical protein
LSHLLRMSTEKEPANVDKECSSANTNHEVRVHWHIAMGVFA